RSELICTFTALFPSAGRGRSFPPPACAARASPVAMPSSWVLAPPPAKLRPGEDGAVAPCADHPRHAIVRSCKGGTGHDLSGRTTLGTAGERLARALAAQDSAALCALLAEPVDFQALTPGRHWQATTGRQVADEIIFRHWFGTGADILELCSVSTGRVSEREHVADRVR